MKPSVMLISVDAMKPEFIFESEKHGVDLPNIRKYFLENGTYAKQGVQSVFPPFTYPCHQSIITGTNPIKHGTTNNNLFDPMNVHKGAWYWHTTQKVKTLWEAAKQSGYIVASAAFPASAGAPGDYIAPEFWYDGTEFDNVLVDLMATPQGLVAEMERDIGRYPNGYYLDNESDVQRFKALMWLMEHKLTVHLPEKPFFLTGYFGTFDTNAHDYGVYSKEAADSLEKIDQMLGELIAKAHEITNDNVVVCVVSDHGSLDNDRYLYPNVLFRNNGLIETDENGNIIDWKVYSLRAGGICDIRLKDKDDAETYEKVKALLEELAADPDGGVEELLFHDGCVARGGQGESDFAIVAKKGCEIRDEAIGNVYEPLVKPRAQHGYCEFYEEMRASFLIEGVNISKKKDVNFIKLVDIAPTLARIMGCVLEDADGHNILAE